MTLPSAGEWQLNVDMKKGPTAASASAELNVLPQEAPAERYWPFFAMVPLLVLVVCVQPVAEEQVAQESASTAIAALRPLIAITLPPGCVHAPQRYTPGMPVLARRRLLHM